MDWVPLVLMVEACKFYDLCSLSDNCPCAPDEESTGDLDLQKAPSCFRGRVQKRVNKNKALRFKDYETD